MQPYALLLLLLPSVQLALWPASHKLYLQEPSAGEGVCQHSVP